MHVDKLLIVGLGLIGGSLARSLRKTGFARRITGYGHREASLKKGVELGVIDGFSLDLEEALQGADLVVIGAPTLKAAELLQDILQRVDSTTIITDVASVKGSLVQASQLAREEIAGGTNVQASQLAREGIAGGTNEASQLAREGSDVYAPNFVPGHPIAGSERSGVEASDASLFVDHRVILTPTESTDPAALSLVRAMWESTGAQVLDMGVAEHDAILAATSHLPHVLAYALVDALARSELSEDIFRYAAGGFRDFTRIASSDPVMWRDIALANRVELLKAIDSFSDHLQLLRTAVANSDADALHRIFTDAKSARDAFVDASAATRNLSQ